MALTRYLCPNRKMHRSFLPSDIPLSLCPFSVLPRHFCLPAAVVLLYCTAFPGSLCCFPVHILPPDPSPTSPHPSRSLWCRPPQEIITTSLVKIGSYSNSWISTAPGLLTAPVQQHSGKNCGGETTGWRQRGGIETVLVLTWCVPMCVPAAATMSLVLSLHRVHLFRHPWPLPTTTWLWGSCGHPHLCTWHSQRSKNWIVPLCWRGFLIKTHIPASL